MSAKNLIIRGGADFSAVKKELDKTQRNLTAFQKGIKTTMAGIGVVLGGFAIGNLVKDILQTSAKTETLNVAMMAVAHSTGTSVEALKEYKKSVMGLGIAEQEATQVLTRFMQANLNVADALKITRVAQDAGTIASMNSSEAVEQMTEAIAKQRPQLLTAFGFTKNLNSIYGDYAKSVGKATNRLSEAEKKQAMVNYILEEGEKIAGSYEAAMGTFGKKLGSIDKLTLPKKLMQELKTAIGAPLILPGAGVVLDGMIEQLHALKMWALDNEQTLRRWGESVASAVRNIGKGIKALTNVFVENWGAIKHVGIALLSYVTLTKGAELATKAFKTVQLALKGELVSQIPILSRVSLAVGTYRLQMALAPATVGIFTRSLYGLRAALYGVWTALGPIGWGILALSGLISGGMALWSKYSNSLNTVAMASGKQIKSGEESAGVIEDQAEALKEAGKAAKNNLQGFDEIHQIQKDMAGSGEGMLDELGLGDMGAGGVPPLNLDEMMGEMELVKPTLKGFWEWTKQGFISLGEVLANIVKSYWSLIGSIIKGYWEMIANLTRPIWEPIVEYLTFIWDKLGQHVFKVFGLIGKYIIDSWKNVFTLTFESWGVIINFLKDQWENIKTTASNIFKIIKDIITGNIDLRTGIKAIWEEILSFLKKTWENIRKAAETIWGALGKFFETQLNLTKKLVVDIWSAIKENLEKVWGLIKSIGEIIWKAIQDVVINTTQAGRDRIISITEGLKNSITNTWNSIKSTASSVWESIKNAMVNPIESAKNTLFRTIESIKNAFANMKITIPKPKVPDIKVTTKTKSIAGVNIPYPSFDVDWYAQGGIFNGPSVIGVGEAGAEAVLPLERNTEWMDNLAAKIAGSISGGNNGDIYVYVGNEQVDAYIQRSKDRHNTRSNGR